MPLPRWLGRFNFRFTNRLTRPPARWLPWFGVIEHVGRHTGTEYQTTVNVFGHGDRYVIALTYGPESEWVQNVLAADGCQMITRGRRLRLTDPRRYEDPRRSAMPWLVRLVLGVLRVRHFLELRAAPGGR
jgi:deazaflavin-dependent oxidoreductase (nitroreductase family)